MPEQHTQPPKKEKRKRCKRSPYQFISYEDRLNLIKKVTEEGFSVYRMAIEMNINHSTAKVIMRRYKRQGVILNKVRSKLHKKMMKKIEKESSTGKQVVKEEHEEEKDPSPVKIEEQKEFYPFEPYLQDYENCYWGYYGWPIDAPEVKQE